MKRLAFLTIVTLVLSSCTASSSPSESTAPSSEPEAPASESVADARPDGVPAEGEDALVDEIYERGVLRGCSAISMPIVGISTTTNEPYGLAIAFGQELADRMGVEWEVIMSEWDGLLPAVQTGRCDIITAGLGLNPQRAEVVDYVLTSIKAGICYLCSADDERLTTWEDALETPGVTVCGKVGTAFSTTMQTEYPDVEFIELPATGGAGLAPEIVAGRCDITNFDNWIVPYVLDQYPQLKVIPEDCTESPLETYDWGFAVVKGHDEFHSYIEGVVSELESDGTIDEWFTTYSSPEQMAESFGG